MHLFKHRQEGYGREQYQWVDIGKTKNYDIESHHCPKICRKSKG